MLDYLYAFGLGLTFIGGMVLGGMMVVRIGRKRSAEENDRYMTHLERVEDRLQRYTENSAALVTATREQTNVAREMLDATRRALSPPNYY